MVTTGIKERRWWNLELGKEVISLCVNVFQDEGQEDAEILTEEQSLMGENV